MPTNNHSALLNAILARFGPDPRVRIFKNVVGFDRERQIKYGQVGSADILGIVAPTGRALAIEVKTGAGVLSKQQRAWRRVFERYGGLYVLARSVEDVEEALA